MNKAQEKAIIWDFDGTIYHSEDSYREYAKCIGNLIGSSDGDFVEKCMGVIKDRENKVGDDGWAVIANLSKGRISEAEMNKCFAEVRNKMNMGRISVTLQKSAVEILKIRRVKHFLLTNTPEAYASPLLENLGIKGMFHKIIYSSKKPDLFKEITGDLLMQENIEASNVLSIGDNYKNDILPSIQMGFTTVFIQLYERNSRADLTVSSLNEAIPFIEKFIEG